jgi:hypothetical protein
VHRQQAHFLAASGALKATQKNDRPSVAKIATWPAYSFVLALMEKAHSILGSGS